jgi:hypothetical protein
MRAALSGLTRLVCTGKLQGERSSGEEDAADWRKAGKRPGQTLSWRGKTVSDCVAGVVRLDCYYRNTATPRQGTVEIERRNTRLKSAADWGRPCG